MSAHSYATPDDIDITSIWSTLRRSLRKILLASLLVGVFTFGLFSMVASKYNSEAQLSIVARGGGNPFSAPRQDGSASDSVSVRMDKEAINTHVRALKSSDLATEIANELNLKDKVEFNSALGSVDMLGGMLRLVGIGGAPKSQSVEDRVLNAYFEKLDVYAPKESRFIVVRFQSVDPQLAAAIANTLATKYRSTVANRTVVENNEVQKKLRPEIDRLMQEAAAAQAAVEKFRGEANIFKGGRNSTGLNQQQLAELTAELSKAKASRSNAEARMRSARELLKRGAADASADVLRSPIVQNLIQQRVRVERQIAELSATLLPGHPRMKQLYADLRGLRRQVKSEVGKVVESLEKEAAVAALREESIARSLAELKTKVVSTGPNEVKLANLEAVAKSKRAELERVQAQYEANRARAQSRAVPVEAQLISRARVASVPSSPKKLQYALLASFATLLFGIAAAVLGTLWSGARTGAVHDRVTATPSMPSQPTVNLGRLEPQPAAGPSAGPKTHEYVKVDVGPTLDRPDVQDAVTTVTSLRSIAELAGRIESRNGQGGYRTLITSDVGNLDAREEALGVANELAAARSSVIVVDWSPDQPGLAADVGVAAAPGLNELFAGSATFQDVVQAMPESTVHVIAMGEPPAQGVTELDADKINLILDALDEAYNNIIVVARHDAARQLFEVIEGRFDAGVTVAEPKGSVAVIQDPPGTFLGFQVADIDVVMLERKLSGGMKPGRALLRSMGKPSAANPEYV